MDTTASGTAKLTKSQAARAARATYDARDTVEAVLASTKLPTYKRAKLGSALVDLEKASEYFQQLFPTGTMGFSLNTEPHSDPITQ